MRGLLGHGAGRADQWPVTLSGEPVPPYQRMPTARRILSGPHPAEEIAQLRKECAIKGISLHGALMQRCGWPAIPYDGQLLVSHQDALLLGGKVQAPPGYADHVVFLYPELCEKCGTKICIELCSGQAITPGGGAFRRSTAKNASTAAPATGIAPSPSPKPRAHEHRVPRRRRGPAFR